MLRQQSPEQKGGTCPTVHLPNHMLVAAPSERLVMCSADDMRRYGVRTILDLRRMDRPCKKKGKKIDKLLTAARAARKV